MPRQFGTTGIQSFSSAPAVGVEGSTYWDSVNNKLFVSVDGAWVPYVPVPPGGGVGQVLTKDAGLDHIMSWANPAGGTPSGAAGGDLTGTYPNPTIGTGKVTSTHIADGTITDTDVAAANKDGVVGTASMRTLGTGAQQAAVGSHGHILTDANITGTLAVAKGGTGSATALTQGGVKYGVTTTAEGTSAAGSSGQLMVSGGSGAPTWAAADLTTMPQSWVKESVVCATVGNITMSGVAVNVDNIVPSAGQRVLVKDQALPAENGIYVAAAGAWTRATDAALSSHIAGATVNVDNGTVNGGYVFTNNFKTTDTLGTTGMIWAKVAATGETWLAPVRLTTGNHSLSGLAAIDGVTPVAGDRIGAFFQSTTTQNGIYLAASGAWTRAPDANANGTMPRYSKVYCREGSDNAGKTWVQLNTFTTIGTDSVTYRVHNVVDYVAAFTFPNPVGIGHMVYDSSAELLKIWTGGAWAPTNGIFVCTSSTRPAFASDDCIIYETDTTQTFLKVAGTWTPISQVAIQASQPTEALDLWVDTDEFGTPFAGAPTGAVSHQQLTSTFGTTSASTTVVDVTNLAVTVNADGVRRYKMTVHVNFTGTVAGDRVALVIREGTTQIQGGNFIQGAATTLVCEMTAVLVPASGTHTYTVGFYRGAGTGTISLLGTATAPAFLLIEDIGV